MSPLIPSVSFSSERHICVRLGRHLRLWSKPSAEDAASTMGMILAFIWIPISIGILLLSQDILWTIMTLGIVDGIGRLLGVKSSYVFIPIWVVCLVCSLILSGLSVIYGADFKLDIL